MIASSRDIGDLIGAGFSAPDGHLSRDKSDFSPEFWDLRTGLLGELAQKLVNYRMYLTLTGDFSEELAGSRALRDVFQESGTSGPIRLG
ncbi:DUF4180 domain-containing protein [Pelagovum pacificum]|uniref:DUF4180 domain-containing protein n=1 Tax=Pelagovum pacificum TaxID=2588711 RepID=UPI0018CCECC6|nr:DUF4180 domain-containing protein [Pelagovum pacificum]QQA44856.1 DUF4180 domain-containing protein [Pelagovum pacificum]